MPKSSFQDIILTLQQFWAAHGCLIWQPYYTQVGAGTMNPATFLRVLGPEPWNVAYVEPSIRPDDGRYGENPNRFQQHYQYQVILKPDPGNPQELYLRLAGGAGPRPARARHPLRGGQLGVARPGRLGPGLGGVAGRAGDHPVHLLPAGGRPAARPGVGGDHLRPGAHPDRAAQRAGHLGRAVERGRDLRRSAAQGRVRAQQVLLRDRRRGPLREMYDLYEAEAEAAWPAGWCCPPTITCSNARTPSTCWTRAARWASPSARRSSGTCATWHGAWR